MTREIDSHHWPEFCDRISRQRAGATVKLEVLGANGVKTERFANVTFQGMSFNESDACSDVISLRLKNTREIVHEFIEPIQLRLHPAEAAGIFSELQIEAENGVAFLTFHPALNAQMLEGFQAG